MKREILKSIRKREEFANYLQEKARRYSKWRLFVLKDTEKLKRKLRTIDN